MMHFGFEQDPELDRRCEVIYNANLHTFDDFVAACNDAEFYPEIVLLQQFERHGRFLSELAQRGSELAPRDDQRWSNMLEYACMRTNLEGAKVAVALGAAQDLPDNGYLVRTLLTTVLTSGYNSHQPMYDLIRYIASICPRGLNRNNYDCPLDTAICIGFHGAVRLLVELGSPIDSISMELCVDRIIDTPIGDACEMADCCRYLVAMGGRLSANLNICYPYHRRGFSVYTNALGRVTRSRNAVVVVLGLARVGGRVHGNGRDVLRLLAKEVWMSRMDEGWGMVEGLKRSKKFDLK